MIKFLKIQYQIGKITKEQLDSLVEKGKITQDDVDEIVKDWKKEVAAPYDNVQRLATWNSESVSTKHKSK